MLEVNKIYCQNCIEGLKLLDDNSIDCCVTSPPYWGLRDYGVSGQFGLEATPEEYVAKMVATFREVKRVLKPEGTLWLNLGDSYNGYKGNSVKNNFESDYAGFRNQPARESKFGLECKNLKPKDLIGIPWLIAFALRADGWYLRQDIIWHKPNPMPESVTDRCTKAHEYIFLMAKSQKYYCDMGSIAETVAQSTVERLKQDINNQKGSDRVPGKTNGSMKAVAPRYGGKKYTEDPSVFNRTKSGNAYDFREMRNKRSVWTVTTKPSKEAHFATFPSDLIEPCILAGSRVGGIVLDPFMGSGTTALVALKNNRNYIGFELNPEYIKIAERRLENVQQRLFI